MQRGPLLLLASLGWECVGLVHVGPARPLSDAQPGQDLHHCLFQAERGVLWQSLVFRAKLCPWICPSDS